MPRPELCFVVMSYGRKTDAAGATTDFDAVYRDAIRPAIEDAGLEPLRADEEVTDGVIHKAMFERLVLCRFAVADLTGAGANVFYELGVRHAVRPASTVLLFAESGRLPFDVAPLRALPYALTPAGVPADPAALRASLAERLRHARATAADAPVADSPLFQLLDGYPAVASDRADVFRDRVQYAASQKEALRKARAGGVAGVRAFERALGSLEDDGAGLIVDLFLSYRDLSAWAEMVRLAEGMPRILADTVLVREQYALALNRLGRGEDAEGVLRDLLARRGASSETYGILGRVYKDRWNAAAAADDALMAPVLLEQAIESYLRGFEADWAHAYPGVNALTLMEVRDPSDPRQAEVLPVVRYGVNRRIARGAPDYWDFATQVELAVLVRDRAAATRALARAVTVLRDTWEAETTADNLRLIREARTRRGEDAGWVETIEDELLRRGAAKTPPPAAAPVAPPA